MEHPLLECALDNYNAKHERTGEKFYKISDLSIPEVYANIVCSIGAEHVYEALRLDPTGQPQKSIRDTQVKAIADSFGIMNSAFNPVDAMILMGSQTNDWSDLFEPAIKLYLEGGLQLDSVQKPYILSLTVSYNFDKDIYPAVAGK